MSDFEVNSYLGDYPFFDKALFPITIDGVTYEEEDAHILVANGNSISLPCDGLPIFVAVNGVDVTPTSLTTRTVEFEEIGVDGVTTTTEEVKVAAISATDGDTIHAIFDWNNSTGYAQNWFKDILQFGSRSPGGEAAGYVNPPALPSGRIPNQLKKGRSAFIRTITPAHPSAISDLDVSNLNDAYRMFYQSPLASDISKWNTSNIENMGYMFYQSNTNSDISGWDTSKVTNMAGMFYYATLFNQDISGWNTSKVKDMLGMFYNAFLFNQDLSKWCVSEIQSKPTDFDTDANAWTKSKPVWGTCPRGENIDSLLPNPYITEDCHLFIANENPVNFPIPNGSSPIFVVVDGVHRGYLTEVKGKVYNGSTIYAIFDWDNAAELSQNWFSEIRQFGSRSPGGEPAEYVNPPALPSGRIPEQLKTGNRAFYGMKANPEIISNLDVSNVTDMFKIFQNTTTFSRSLNDWDTSNVTNMNNVFQFASVFNSDISNWNVSKVLSMNNMFKGTIFNQDISNWNTINVQNMFGVFESSGFNSNISEWNTSKVKDMRNLCKSARYFNQDLSEWCTSSVSSYSGYADGATAWQTLNKPRWGTCPRGEDKP